MFSSTRLDLRFALRQWCRNLASTVLGITLFNARPGTDLDLLIVTLVPTLVPLDGRARPRPAGGRCGTPCARSGSTGQAAKTAGGTSLR
jgi:hypothetical protein